MQMLDVSILCDWKKGNENDAAFNLKTHSLVVLAKVFVSWNRVDTDDLIGGGQRGSVEIVERGFCCVLLFRLRCVKRLTFCCGFFLRLAPFAARCSPLVAHCSPLAMAWGGKVDGLDIWIGEITWITQNKMRSDIKCVDLKFSVIGSL